MFTSILIALGSLFVIVTVVNEIRAWRKPAPSIGPNASSDDDKVNRARLIQETNIHDREHFNGSGF